MIKNNDKISENQTTILLFTTILGAGILSLSSDVAQSAGPDSLIALLLGGIIAFIFCKINRTYCFKVSNRNLCRVFGKISYKAFICHYKYYINRIIFDFYKP